MIKSFFLLLASMLSISAASITLIWDANTESDLAGYNIYMGGSSTNYTNKINVGNVTTNKINELVRGHTYYFAATAYNTNGAESDFSNEVTYTPIDIPTNSNITISQSSTPSVTFTAIPSILYTVQATTNFITWEDVQQYQVSSSSLIQYIDLGSSNYTARFFRLKME